MITSVKIRPSNHKLGPVVQKFRVWLGLLLLNLSYGLISLLGASFSIVDGKMFAFFAYLTIFAFFLRECLLPYVIVHERGIRLLRLHGYRAIKWEEIENMEVGYITSIRLRNGRPYKFYTSVLSDDDDKARIITLIRKLSPELDIKIADEQARQTRRVNVDIVAAVFICIAFMSCLAATLLMFARLDSSAFTVLVAWAAFVLSLTIAGKRREIWLQRYSALCSCVVAGGSFVYYYAQYQNKNAGLLINFTALFLC